MPASCTPAAMWACSTPRWRRTNVPAGWIRRFARAWRTGISWTGEFNRAIETDVEQPPYVTALALLSLGKHDEAIAICQSARARMPWNDHLGLVLDALGAIVSRDYEAGRAAVSQLLEFAAFSDPEGWYYWAQAAAGLEDRERAFDLLSRAVDTGLHCVRGLETTPLLDSLRMESHVSARSSGGRALVTPSRRGHSPTQMVIGSWACRWSDRDGARVCELRPRQRPRRKASARPRPLEVEAAEAPVDVQNLADEVEAGTHARLHRRRVDLVSGDAAGRHLGVVVAARVADGERPLEQRRATSGAPCRRA